MANPGVDTYIIDEASAGADPTSTDTLYLLSTAGSAVPLVYDQANSGDATLDAELDAYFRDGGRAVTVQGYATSGSLLPTLSAAIDLLPAGPGQIVAPEITTAASLITVIDKGWAQNKVTICNGGASDSDGTLETLAGSIIAGSDGGSRGGILCADTAQYPGSVSGQTNDVPWSITLAALVARQDRLTNNPGNAAAGANGVSTAVGVSDERTATRRATLKTAQVNTAKLVAGQYRQYGIRSLADLNALPDWWNWWGARVIMAFRARVAAIGEAVMFGELSGPHRGLVTRFGDLLAAEAKALFDLGALYGDTPAEAFRIDVGETVNTPTSLGRGELAANCYLKVSENAEHVTINLIRRSLSAATV
jgi:hypothetical protein